MSPGDIFKRTEDKMKNEAIIYGKVIEKRNDIVKLRNLEGFSICQSEDIMNKFSIGQTIKLLGEITFDDEGYCLSNIKAVEEVKKMEENYFNGIGICKKINDEDCQVVFIQDPYYEMNINTIKLKKHHLNKKVNKGSSLGMRGILHNREGCCSIELKFLSYLDKEENLVELEV